MAFAFLSRFKKKKRPKVGLGVFVVKDGKILMGKRKNAHGEGTWSLPGGHLEMNEEVEDCARRETLEEAGIHIKNIKRTTFTNDVFDSEKKHYITLFVVAEHDSGSVKVMEPHKCEQWDWFSWENLPEPLFLPLQNLLKQGFNPVRYL